MSGRFIALLLLAGAALAWASHRSHDSVPAKPNVVFVVLDTLRFDRFAGERNGMAVMPFLNEFAAGGARFDQAVSPASWTRPVLASLMTGTYPETNKVRFEAQLVEGKQVSDALAPSFETMPEMLAAAGYDNWAFQTNPNVHADLGFAQGFGEGRYDFGGFRRAKPLTDRVLARLGQVKPPFFLFVQYMDPHAPYDPVEEYREVFGPQPVPSGEDAVHLDRGPDEWRTYLQDDRDSWLGSIPKRRFEPLSEEGQEAIRYRYDAECRYLDDQLARLVGTIEGRHPNTLFVVVSDHGDEFWERGTCGHGQHVYQELVHVPLIVKGPGVPAGVYTTPVGTIGVFPTVAKLVGLPAIPQWQAPDVFTQVAHPAPAYSWAKDVGGYIDAESVTIANDKLIDDRSKRRSGRSRFDLVADPGETRNLWSSSTDADAQMLGALERHREAEAASSAAAKTTAETLSPDLRKRLGELGYLEEDSANQ